MNLTTIYEDNTAFTYGASSFSLDQCPSYSELVAVFDQYRITGVELSFWPTAQSVTNTNSAAAVVNTPSRLVTAIDYDDAVVPSSSTALREYSTCQVHSITESFKMRITPAVSVMVYEGVGTTGYSPQWGTWISTNDPTVPHYGLKYALAPNNLAGADNAYGTLVEAKIHLEFRMSK